jgi:hypothetical protein
MKSNSESEMEVIMGQPVDVKLAGREIRVEQMSMDAQIEVVDIYVAAANEKGMKPMFDVMVRVCAKATGIDEQEIRTKSVLVEIVEAFTKVWKQNGLDFLLQRVRRLNSMFDQKA